MITIYELISRLVLAVVLGGAIGWERQQAKKPAGLRTHILVSLGSAVFTLISFLAGPTITGQPIAILRTGAIDHTRIAAAIVIGIGFLGAGTIIRSGGNVLGLTTAASIWIVAGIGMACGFGMYSLAIIAAILVILTLFVLEKIEEKAEIKNFKDKNED